MNAFNFLKWLFIFPCGAVAMDFPTSTSEVAMYTCLKETLSEQNKSLNEKYNKLIIEYKKEGPWSLSNIPSRDVYLKKHS